MALHDSDLVRIKEALHAGGIHIDNPSALSLDNLDRTFTNGAEVALRDLFRALETLSTINDAADDTATDDVDAVLERLTDSVRRYDNERTFTLFWLTGDAQLIYGPNISTAMNNAGIGAGALSALDFYAAGDITDQYDWNSETRRWDKTADA